MKWLQHIAVYVAAFTISSVCLDAQIKVGEFLEIDKTVHNFGDIIHQSGPVSCSFMIRNTGEKPVVIYNVISTCGCTDVEWTKEPIRPGQSGKISVTYSNDEGAYPFDKTLTTYISDVKKPVLLKIRGVSLEQAKPLKEMYPVSFGPLAMKSASIKCGNLEQGEQKSEAVMVANPSQKPAKVEFTDVDKNLSISISPNPIPPGSTAEMSFTVTADRKVWGKNTYYATPVVNGQEYRTSDNGDRLGIWAFTKENFSDLTQEERFNGPRPNFKESTWSFGVIKKGETVHTQFTFRNEGKECFCIYKVNSDAKRWSHSTIPAAMPGDEVTFRVHLDTSDLPLGEHLTTVTLTTNSPSRPIINLFIAGYIE